MASCIVCPLCSEPGHLATATEVAQVQCHVRRLQEYSFKVWRCTGCNSLHSGDTADLAFFYSHYPLQNHRLDFHARIGYGNRLRMLRERGLQPGNRILDYGCGTGVFLEFLREKGYRNAFGYDAFVSKYSDPSILQSRYDVVVSYDVIEHVDDPAQLMRTFTGLLRKGGLLAIGTPNADQISLKRDHPAEVELSQPYHRHILSERVLVELAKDHGFDVEHIYRRFYFDSLYPAVNTRFMWAYILGTGGMIDVAVEPPQVARVLRSPRLLFYAFFGYFFPPRGNMLASFRYNRPAGQNEAGS